MPEVCCRRVCCQGETLSSTWLILMMVQAISRPRWMRRWTIVALCFFAFMLCNMDRVNMSIAILPMSKQFNWDSQTIGVVQSSFFWWVRPAPHTPPPESTLLHRPSDELTEGLRSIRYGALGLFLPPPWWIKADSGKLAMPFNAAKGKLKYAERAGNWHNALDIAAWFARGYLLTQVLGGVWADKFGGKKVLGFGVLWWSAATALTPIAAKMGLGPLLLARACMGIGEGVAMPAMNNMLSRSVFSHIRSQSPSTS